MSCELCNNLGYIVTNPTYTSPYGEQEQCPLCGCRADNKHLAAENVALRDVLDAAIDYVNTVNNEYAERDDKDLAHDELCEAVAIYNGGT